MTVLEAGAAAGGKAGRWESGGFAFDTGPSLLTMPRVFEELFEDTGAPLDVELVRVEPVTRYTFADGSSLRAQRRSARGDRGARGMVAGCGRRLGALSRDVRAAVEQRDRHAGPEREDAVTLANGAALDMLRQLPERADEVAVGRGYEIPVRLHARMMRRAVASDGGRPRS